MSQQAEFKQTEFLSDQDEIDQIITGELSFRAVTHDSVDERKLPVWLIRFTLTTDKEIYL